MIVYFFRHASSGVRRKNPSLDRKRGLDKEGKCQCLVISAYLNALRISFDAIVSSPLKRALQTASLVATEIGFEQNILTGASLEPSGKFWEFPIKNQTMGSGFTVPEPIIIPNAVR